MVEKKEVEYILASEARAIAEEAQKQNLDKAMKMIKGAITTGSTECMLFNNNLTLNDVQKLMDMGYTVSQVTNPFDLIKSYKIGW